MILIRKMTLQDVAQVHELEKLAFSMPWSRQDFEDAVENKDSLYLVAEETKYPGKVIACCGMRSIVGEGDISNVSVHPDKRQKGIAGKMLAELLKRGEEEYGVEAYTLEVRKSNVAAIKLYSRLGFTEEGVRKNFYEKPVEDAVIMWKR